MSGCYSDRTCREARLHDENKAGSFTKKKAFEQKFATTYGKRRTLNQSLMQNSWLAVGIGTIRSHKSRRLTLAQLMTREVSFGSKLKAHQDMRVVDLLRVDAMYVTSVHGSWTALRPDGKH